MKRPSCWLASPSLTGRRWSLARVWAELLVTCLALEGAAPVQLGDEGAGREVALHCEGGRFKLRVHLELLQDVLHVGADRVGADEQLTADAGVVPAAAEQGEHLALPGRQPVQRRVGGSLAEVEQASEQVGQHGPGD